MADEPADPVFELFTATLARPAHERDAFVAERCAGDDAMLHEVRSLLAHHRTSGGVLDLRGPKTGTKGGTRLKIAGPGSGDRIGGFRLLEVLGTGGMGVVFRAEQETPRRTVALKLVRPGLATQSLLKRFAHEAQVLALLHHPGIAQIYETGMADAGSGPQPYFAMELVQGRPLSEYMKAERLGPRRVLELFARICDAVEHAHAQGVVHRDLKPANIIVDQNGQPKILDFGVARVTQPDLQASTLHTQRGQLVGTIPYMSPEQVAGSVDAVDTRSDVYALGVILYELLAGKLPYDLQDRGFAEAARAIREDDPAPLSSIDRTYRGDIETIVAKALEKEPARRYASAAELAADLRRYLGDEPVVARPASALYRMRKFSRRHRALVAGAAAVAVVLVAGIVGVSLALVRAIRAEDAAIRQSAQTSRQAEKARTISAFLQEMLSGIDPDVARTSDRTLLRRILDEAAARIDASPLDPEVEASLRHTIGRTYHFAGLNEQALPHLERAFALRKQVLGEESKETLLTLNLLASLRQDMGRNDEAEALYLRGIELDRRVYGPDDPETLELMNNLVTMYLQEHRLDEAEALALKTLELKRQKLGEEAPATLQSLANLASVYGEKGDWNRAAPLDQQVFDATLRILGEENRQTLNAMNNLAVAYRHTGRAKEAEPLYERALALSRRLCGPRHPDTLRAIANLAMRYSAVGRYDDAEGLYLELVAAAPEVFGPDDPITMAAIGDFASLYRKQGMWDEAEPLAADAAARARRALPTDDPHRAPFLINYAKTLAELRKFEQAEAVYLEAQELLDALPQRGPAWTTNIRGLVDLYDAWHKTDAAAAWRNRLANPHPADGK